mgnify:CR=1 FL=1
MYEVSWTNDTWTACIKQLFNIRVHQQQSYRKRRAWGVRCHGLRGVGSLDARSIGGILEGVSWARGLDDARTRLRIDGEALRWSCSWSKSSSSRSELEWNEASACRARRRALRAMSTDGVSSAVWFSSAAGDGGYTAKTHGPSKR